MDSEAAKIVQLFAEILALVFPAGTCSSDSSRSGQSVGGSKMRWRKVNGPTAMFPTARFASLYPDYAPA